MKQCYGYVRVSTQKQGLGVSLEAQREAIELFAHQHNLTVCDWFEERETAAKRGRPVFTRMIRQLKQGKAAGLIMHKIDRSARNLRDWALVSELPNAGIDIYFATESLDFRSRGGRLAANLQAVIAEDYIHNLREETKKGLDGRLKQGLYPFRAPIGYLDNGRGQPKTPCPKMAPLVQEAFALYAARQHSMRTLTAEMERRGLRNLNGGPVSLHGIETILNNLFYTGEIFIKRTGATYPGIHEPLITVATFRRVQDIKMGKAGKKVTRHSHLYQGLFRCGLCSGPMSPELQKGHVYYRCQQPACATKTVREETLSSAIITSFQSVQLTDQDAAELECRWRGWLESDEMVVQIKSVELRIEQAEGRMKRLTDLLVDGTITEADFHERKRGYAEELASLAEEREDLERHQLQPEDMRKFIELMKNLAELHISANRAEKRSMLRYCFSNRQVVRKEPELKPHSWLSERNFSDLSPLVTQLATDIELSTLLERHCSRKSDTSEG